MRYLILSVLLFSFSYAETKLTCVGSTTIQPLIEKVSKTYKKEAGIDLKAEGGGSQFGIDMVLSGKADIAMVNRNLSDKEKNQLSFVVIGQDSLAFIVNNSNPLKNISKNDLTELYSGRIKNWKKINGQDEDVILLSKQSGRSALVIFEEYSGLFHSQNLKNSDKSKTIEFSAWEAGSNNDMLVWVGGLQNAIGFVAFGSALNATAYGLPIKILKLEGIAPSKENILNGTYPIIRPLNLVFDRSNKKAKEFSLWILNDYAQSIIDQNSFIKVHK